MLKFAFFIALWGLLFFNTTAQNQYWQQNVNYVIDVELFPEKAILKGQVYITYKNNSPSTLNELYIHLWPNAFKNNKTPFSQQFLENGSRKFWFANEDERGFIDSLDFFVNGRQVTWHTNSNAIDIAKVELTESLLPGKSIVITTPFFVKIPAVFSRFGHDKNSDFQITQWYPKVAVFDHKGWHPMSYLDQGEFYSDFGHYEVNITLPANYVVAATGVLQNKEEEQWLNNLEKATRNGIRNEYTFTETEQYKKRVGKKTLSFVQNDVIDFAWFASKDFLQLKKEIEQPSGVKTFARAFFHPDDVYMWEKALDYIELGLTNFSEKLGDYPYAHYTVVSGALGAGAGMEYPMISVISPKHSNDLRLKSTIVHEVGHSWFQAVIANNERQHAWMDEGFTTFYEEWALADEIGVDTLHFQQEKMYYDLLASNRSIQPINEESSNYTRKNYVSSVYGASSFAIHYLKAYLGNATYSKAMQAYYDQWKFKHPYPEDVQQLFEQISGKDLSWFFNDLINAALPPDYALRRWTENGVEIKNNRNLAVPFTLTYLSADNEILTTEWIEGFEGKKIIPLSMPRDSFEELVIFHDKLYPEQSGMNNNLKTSGVFKKADKVRLFSPFSFSKKKKQALFKSIDLGHTQNDAWLIPGAHWNYGDKFQPGVLLTNTTINTQPFEYELVPLFATRTQDVTGLGKLVFNFFPQNNLVHKIQPYVTGKHFNHVVSGANESDFYQTQAGLNVLFTKPDARSTIIKNATAQFTFNKIEHNPVIAGKDEEWFADFSFTRENKRKFNPNKLNATLQTSRTFTKAWGEYNYRYDFEKKGQFVKFRSFAGFMLSDAPTATPTYNFSAIARDGFTDYDYQHLYFDRSPQSLENLANGTSSSNFSSHLVYLNDGALKLREHSAQTADIYAKNLLAINLETTLPVNLPLIDLRPFADIAFIEKVYQIQGEKTNLLYDVGLSAGIGDVFRLYYPLAFSNEFKPQTELEKLKFSDKLIFTMQLNPLKIKEALKNEISH